MSTSSTFIGSLDVDNVTTSLLDEKSKLPLIISPRLDDSLEFLCHWLVANRPWVDEQILNYGAVLIRGFQVNDAPEFERAIQSLQPSLSDSYRGTSPRSVFAGTKYTFSAADAPVNYPIAQHCEMSFLDSPPKRVDMQCHITIHAGANIKEEWLGSFHDGEDCGVTALGETILARPHYAVPHEYSPACRKFTLQKLWKASLDYRIPIINEYFALPDEVTEKIKKNMGSMERTL